ncbi:hypothetical protein HPB52_019123 [Rhipicephalus sanguineus]|uniref:Uncharacterized protein n=1 Tax=Rhipicephalus sanguineus TaxID=34632 RepID=A0A9D4PP62_RHISA|nr:hypothetical protein HPB52_019123 [Rhipicephalus sanguineus]
MGDARLARLSVYAEKLDANAKQRYADKVALCGGVDPLILTSKEAAFDIELVPKVELSDIKDYLVHASSFVTHEQLKAKKSLEDHKFLTSGFLQELLLKSHGDCIVVRAKVNHSEALTIQPFEPWLLVKKDGAVKAAHSLVIEKPSQSEWTEFLNSVKEAGTQSAVLAVTKGYTEDFIPISVKYSNALLGQMA